MLEARAHAVPAGAPLVLSWMAPASVLAAGVALGDCALIAAAPPLGLVAFYSEMDARAPMEPFRGAVRVAAAGIASLLAAVGLAFMVVAAAGGGWRPTHDPQTASIGLVAASAAMLYLEVGTGNLASHAMAFLAVAAAALAAGVGTALAVNETSWSICGLPLVVAAAMAISGWRLLHEVFGGLLSAGTRLP